VGFVDKQIPENTKIAFLDQAETLGGAERFLIDFFDSLTFPDYKQCPSIVIGAKNSKYREKIPSSIPLYDFDFPAVRGNGLLKYTRVFPLIASARKLKQRLQEYKATTVFSNTPRTSFVMLFAKMIWRTPQKWIVMIHDFSIPKFILRMISKYCDTVVINSIPTRNYVRTCIREVDFPKIKIVENSIPLAKIPQANPPKNIQKILMLGRIDPQKGQLYALEAADLLLERNPDLQFTIVGSPFEQDERTTQYNEKIQKFAQERSLTNVTFQSEVDSPFEAIQKCDCLLALPTEPESFGRIVIEALSLGKLVLSFDETGPREILKNYGHFLNTSIDLLFVDSQNSMSLAERIGYFADNPEASIPYTQKARLFVEQNFSSEETKKRLIEAILD
jgi:glycosyltransferase involved in cell wall biosynthesis